MKARTIGAIFAVLTMGLWGTVSAPVTPVQAQTAPSPCQLPNYTSFADASCLQLNQNGGTSGPVLTNGALQLTDGGLNEARSAFYKQPVPVNAAFSTSFQFSLTPYTGSADGITFVMQNDSRGATAVGCGGGYLALNCPAPTTTIPNPGSAISKSVAIKFDTYYNQGLGDLTCSTNVDHMGILVNNQYPAPSSPGTQTQVCVPLHGLGTLQARIDYTPGANGTPGTLNAYLGGTQILSYSLDLAATLGSASSSAATAYVGFTGATGANSSVQQIQNWSFDPFVPLFRPGQDGAYTWGGTSKNPLAITGTGVPGDTISLYANGSCSTSSVGSTTADGSGNWSISVANIAAEGAYTYSATASTSAGVTGPTTAVSGCSNPITVNIDRTTPTSAVTSPALSSNPVYLNASGWNKTCGSNAAYNVCGTASDSGSGVSAVLVAIEGPNGAFWNGQTGTASAYNTAGTWVKANGTTAWGLSVPLPADGVYTIASAAVDNAGNVQQIFQQSVTGLCTASESGGSLSLNGGSLSINGGLCTIDGTSGGAPVSGSLSLNGGSLSLNGGSLSLNGGSLSLNGGLVSLTGGAITVTSVTCTVKNNSGTGTYAFTSSTGSGSLSLNGGSLSLNGGSLSLNGGSLSLNGGSLSLNGGLTSLSGGITPPVAGSLVLLNGGTCQITASNNTSGSLSLNGGSLSLNGGSLSLNGGSSIPAGAPSSYNGGSLSLNGGSLSLNGGSLSLNGGSLSINGGAGGNAGNVVVDNVSPVVSSFTVDGQSSDGAQNINPGAKFNLQFSKSMSASTVSASTISVSPSATTAPACTDPTTCQNASFSGFQPNTLYTVTVGSGATDLAGNPLASTVDHPATFHFTTGQSDSLSSTAQVDGDGDGIPDGWDGTTTPVFSANGQSTNTLALGFSPTHKDLCLVENYMSGKAFDGQTQTYQTYDQHISQAANQAIVNAFANSPVSNPDGRSGVHLVIFEGQYSAGLPSGYSGPYFGGPIGSGTTSDPSMVDPLGDASSGSFNWDSKGTGAESFDDIRTKYFVPTGLSQFCHFALIAHTLGGSGSSGASRGIGASDLVIALGGTVIGQGVGTQQEQEGTVMHELGHNLGLHHGGGPGIPDLDTNYKPNYMSVMNYFYQFEGVPGGFTSNGLDYSHGTVSPLIKNLLNPLAGLGAGASVSGGVFGTRFFCGTSTPIVVADATQPINWNCSSTGPTSGPVQADINGDGNPTETLNDYNDWANLDFLTGTIGYGAVPAPLKATSIDISSSASGGPDSATTIQKASIAHFGWVGFFSPLASDATGTVVNSGNAGKTYPVKFQLKDTSGNYVSWLSAVRSITASNSQICSGGTTTDPIAFATDSAAGLHYDSTANQYVYNWKTPGSGCYMLNVNLTDGTTYRALFSLS